VLDGDGPAGHPVIVCTALLDLDLATEAAARRELARLAAGTAPVVVDASDVFVAVSGFRLLAEHVQGLRRSGRRAQLVVRRQVRRVSHLLGEPVGELCPTLPDALVRARTPAASASRAVGAPGPGTAQSAR